MTRTRTLAVAGLLTLPSAVFVAANLLKYGVGVGQPYDALAPLIETGSFAGELWVAAVVVGGPILAVLMTLRRITELDLGRDGVRVRIRASWSDVLVLAIGLGLLGAIGLYLVGENL